MGRRCIVHIGMHKTGSSSIQHTLFTNRDHFLKKHGVNYFDRYENHGKLLAAFHSEILNFRTVQHHGITTSEDATKYSELLRTELTEAIEHVPAAETFVISGEGISHFHEEGVKNLAAFLSPHFAKVTVCVYVREPFGYANSAAQECVKRGETFEQLLLATLEGKPGPSALPNYKSKLEKFTDVFGQDNVDIREFTKSTLYKGDVVADFIRNVIGIEPDVETKFVNEALDHATICNLEQLNRTAPVVKNGQLNLERSSMMLRSLERIPKQKKKFVFEELDWERFSKVVADDVRWLRDQTNGRVDFDLTPPPPNHTDQPDNPTATSVSLMFALNDALVANQQSRFWMRFFREVWLISIGKAEDKTGLEKIILQCKDPEILFRVSRHLAIVEHFDQVEMALKRTIKLSANGSHDKTLQLAEKRLKSLANRRMKSAKLKAREAHQEVVAARRLAAVPKRRKNAKSASQRLRGLFRR